MTKTILPLKKLRGTLSAVPPDKSIAHRAAMFAALANGRSVITNFSQAADPLSTVECLKGLGVEILREGSTLTVNGNGRFALKPEKNVLDCGNSGTTMRLLSGIIAGAGLNVSLTGDDSLRKRPMKRILDPLKLMGAEIQTSDGGIAPLTFKAGKKLKAIRYELPVASAQVKSCVLLAGLFSDETVIVVEKTPSRDHTERMLGLKSEMNSDGSRLIYSSSRHEIPLINMQIPGDISGAAFWLVAGSILPGSEIKMKNVGVNPTRNAVISILKRMGADITLENQTDGNGGEPVADITVRSSRLIATEISPEEVPNAIDEIPVLSVAMAFANGTSVVRNASELRAKETDRISAVSEMLTKAGVNHKEFPDGLEINGKPGFVPSAAEYESFHDHRIAMAAAVLSLRAKEPSKIIGSECTSISYPGFWDDLELLRAGGSD